MNCKVTFIGYSMIHIYKAYKIMRKAKKIRKNVLKPWGFWSGYLGDLQCGDPTRKTFWGTHFGNDETNFSRWENPNFQQLRYH